MSLGEYFNSLPTGSAVIGFNNEKAFGVVIRFSEQGFGFGEITFAVDKATGKVHFDDECMGTETCGRICERINDSRILIALEEVKQVVCHLLEDVAEKPERLETAQSLAIEAVNRAQPSHVT